MNGAAIQPAWLDKHSSAMGNGTISLEKFVIVISVLAGCQFAIAAMNDVSPSSLWAVLSLVGYLAFLAQLISSAPATVVVSLPLLLLKSSEFGSCVAIESGAFMHEISQTGSPTGGAARLAIALMAFFGVAALIIEPAWRSCQGNFSRELVEISVKRMKMPITLACVFFFAYFTFVGLQIGFPILRGVERLDFKYQLSDPIYASLLGNRPLFVTAMSLLLISPDTRRRAISLFLGMLVISILFGEKFTSLVVMSSIFPVAWLLDYLKRHKALPLARMVFVGSVLGTLTVGTSLNVYFYLYHDFGTAKQRLLDRMAVQGEMWYVGDRDYRNHTQIDWQTISQDLASCMGQRSQDPREIGTEFGPFFVMQQYGDEFYLKNGREKGIYFAFTYPTYWLMISGYTGFAIVWILTSIAYGVGGRLLLIAIIDANLWGAVLGQKAVFQIITGIITGFTFFVFGYKTICIFIAAWLIVFFRNRYTTQNARGQYNKPQIAAVAVRHKHVDVLST